MERFIIARQIANRFYWIKKNLKPINSSHFKKVFFFRVVKPFCDLYYLTYKKLNPDTPWTSPASIEIFKALLTKNMKGFEYGSGGSTIFFASKVKELISIEHNKEWYEHISNRLVTEGVKNVTYQFFDKENDEDYTEETINIGGQNLQHKFQKDFYRYVNSINQFDNETFDFIVVDGRARIDCVVRSINKLKSGGLLIVDNSERDRYQKIKELLNNWPSITTSTGLTDTTIWFKI